MRRINLIILGLTIALIVSGITFRILSIIFQILLQVPELAWISLIVYILAILYVIRIIPVITIRIASFGEENETELDHDLLNSRRDSVDTFLGKSISSMDDLVLSIPLLYALGLIFTPYFFDLEPIQPQLNLLYGFIGILLILVLRIGKIKHAVDFRLLAVTSTVQFLTVGFGLALVVLLNYASTMTTMTNFSFIFITTSISVGIILLASSGLIGQKVSNKVLNWLLNHYHTRKKNPDSNRIDDTRHFALRLVNHATPTNLLSSTFWMIVFIGPIVQLSLDGRTYYQAFYWEIVLVLGTLAVILLYHTICQIQETNYEFFGAPLPLRWRLLWNPDTPLTLPRYLIGIPLFIGAIVGTYIILPTPLHLSVIILWVVLIGWLLEPNRSRQDTSDSIDQANSDDTNHE